MVTHRGPRGLEPYQRKRRLTPAGESEMHEGQWGHPGWSLPLSPSRSPLTAGTRTQQNS